MKQQQSAAWRCRASKIALTTILAALYIPYPVDCFAPATWSRRRHCTTTRTLLEVKGSVACHDASLLEKKTVVELKKDLKSIGLPVSGTKSKLVQRLLDYDGPSSAAGTTEGQASDSGEGGTIDGITSIIPAPLLEALTKRIGGDGLALLPVQEKAFQPIASGSDAVLFAPTGSGKTLAYAIPILSRLLDWKKEGTLKKRKRLSQAKYDSKREPACPPILVLAPSRELSKQIGKVFSQYHPTSSGRVAAVFGGVPLERHASLLRRDLDVIVGTPGRIRELIRERHLSTSHVKSIVLDEADVLLNYDDQPEIEMLLEGMEGDFQLVLASATVNDRVKDVMEDVMEIDESSDGFVFIKDGAKLINGAPAHGSSDAPKVRHWYTAARSSARPGLASDIVATLSPRLGIVFVASKVEADYVAEEMSDRLADVKVSVLHGDMSQSARSRTVASLRQAGGRRKILVATDVASRGLDLPGVDLVVQFGIPRQSGREGTYDRELYTHRSGRAGRVGGGPRPADAILLYDPAEGEARILPELEKELEKSVDVHLSPRPLPSPTDVLHASYERAKGVCSDVGDDAEFTSFFRDRVESEIEKVPADEREEELLDRLTAAMAALSGLGGAVPERSLLTADPRDRTVRVRSDDGEPLSPPEVTRFVKALGSGKLGRVTICGDGSAVFDLVEKRALRLTQAADEAKTADDDSRTLHIELPSTLPEGFYQKK